MTLQALLAATIAGLVGSPHCIGMCGPFALASARSERSSAAWHMGRLTTYALLGGAAGAFGSALPGPAWIAGIVSAALIVWFSAALAGLVRPAHVRVPGLQAMAKRAVTLPGVTGPLLLGATVGLLPCGLVYAALGFAMASGHALAGALTMVAFGLGTVPALAAFALGARRIVAERPRARLALAGVVMVTGLWVVWSRSMTLP